jgi:hypothetical protein
MEAVVSAGVSGASSEQVKKLEEENKKLKYRIVHLLRALDDMEGKTTHAHGSLKLVAQGGLTNLEVQQCKLVALLNGFKFELVQATEELIASKEFKAQNPLGIFPYV